MINREATIKFKGYDPDDLKTQSGKRVWANCDYCGKGRWIKYQSYRALCGSCVKKGREPWNKDKITGLIPWNKGNILPEETRKKISDSKKGQIAWNKGKILSKETRKKISDSKKGQMPWNKGKKGPVCSIDTRQKLSELHKGHIMSKESRQRLSAAKQGIAYDEWESYAVDSPYCPAFNEACKESNREKYNRQCFICGLPESENLTKAGKLWKLSVHHVDMDKDQGCDGKRWKLIPTCIHHHNLHNDLWESRIIYLLNDVEVA